MGMSASQIRYCMLQARKTDVEYQGQQINQQRTTLATQSAAYNTQLLTLSVPTPPSTEEFIINTYEYNYQGEDYKIKGTTYMNQDYTDPAGNMYEAGTYVVDYTSSTVEERGSAGAKYSVTKRDIVTDPNTGNVSDIYYTVVSNSKTYQLELVDGNDPVHVANVNTLLHSLNPEDKEQSWIKGDLSYKYISSQDTFFYAKLANGGYAYFTMNDLENSLQEQEDYSPDEGVQRVYKEPAQSYVVGPQEVEVQGRMYGVSINWTSTGRMASMVDNVGNVCQLNVSTKTDDEGYQNAYNEYLYLKDQYNKKIDDINAQLDVIQAQDKKLELRLQNLDTQENAIKIEMDAVKAVTKGNIEKSFNVFG